MSAISRRGYSDRARHYRYWKAALLGLHCAAFSLFLTGCGKVDLGALAKNALGQAAEAGGDETVASLPLEPRGLKGRTVAEVKEMLGRPQGKLRTQDGEVWLYTEWRVQLDQDDVVVSVEPETAVKLHAGMGPAGTPSTSAAVRPITIVANGGQEVRLGALMPPGKITIVDFYAEWCGPCRRIGPYLEHLAQSDPDVVLVKVDIVKWDTPVTRQYGINSVPNIRVFDRRSQAVGPPTSDFNAVQRYVAQAKKG